MGIWCDALSLMSNHAIKDERRTQASLTFTLGTWGDFLLPFQFFVKAYFQV